MTINENRLEIRSHSDELLKEVNQFMKNRPHFQGTSSISKVEKDLKEQVEVLKRTLRKV